MDDLSPYESDSRPLEPPESSTISDTGTCEEQELFANVASSNPKRRAGRKKFRETRHPVYRGVRKRNNGRWVCEVREPNKMSRIWLGTFPTPEMAARAHDVAVLALRGRSACLNFADSAWLLPVPASTEAKDIQKAAAEAVQAFRPPLSAPGAVSATTGDQAKATTDPSPSQENVFYMDDDVDFGMPGLLANMAEGLLLPPPPSVESESYLDYDLESDADVPLWSFSI